MKNTAFVNLKIYRLCEELADEVWESTKKWDLHSKFTVGRQLVRAADAIGANIAEGAGRGSYADNRRFVRIARGSLNETRHWLRRAYKRKLLSSQEVQHLSSLLNELGPRLNAYLYSIGHVTAKRQSANDQIPGTNDN